MKCKKIKLNPFPCTLHISLKDDLDETVGGITWSCGSDIFVEYDRQSFPRFVVHESQHVLQELEEYIQYTLDKETQAYMLQYIVDNTIKYLSKYR